MSVLGKFFQKAQPRTFGLEVTGWDLKADPPAVLGRELHAGPDSPEIRVSLNNEQYERRKSIAERAAKVRPGGIIRIDSAVPNGVNSYSANWLVPISNTEGHGLLLRGQARIVPRNSTNLKKGFDVEVLAEAPPTRVTTREALEAAIKEALREGHRNALKGATPMVFLRVMDAANPAGAADLFRVHLYQASGTSVDDAINQTVANSKSLQAFINQTDKAVTYPADLLVEVARATQYPVGKDSAEHIPTRAKRYLEAYTRDKKDGTGTEEAWRSAGFTDSLIGLRNMPARPDLDPPSPERYLVMNVIPPSPGAKFSPSGRVEHVQAEQRGPVRDFDEERGPDELPDDFPLEDLPTDDGPSP